MKDQKKDKKLIGAGVVTAIAASLCCITPVLALFAGASGIASTFSWIEPFRPYLIWITVLVLAFAWYQKFFPRGIGAQKQTEIDCACDDEAKPSFWQSKMFLGIVTVFAVVMLAFPHYSYIFYPEHPSNIVQNEQSNISESIYKVEGLTCESCNLHVEHEVSLLPGYLEAIADFKTGIVKVKFDNSKSSEEEVINAINKTGYKVVDTLDSKKKEMSFSTLEVNVKGLTCEGCSKHIEQEVALLPGYLEAIADHKTGLVKVKYDASKTSEKELVAVINKTGFKIIDTISPAKEKKNFAELVVNVNGLTCESCDRNLERQVALLPGYMDAISDFKTGKVNVKYDSSKSTKQEVIDAINKTGYKVIDSLK